MLLRPSTLALAQTTAVIGDVAKNVERHLELATRAADQGADAILFPELSLSGYTLRDLNFECAITPEAPVLAPLRELSRRITIIAGAAERDDRGGVYNAAFLFEDGAHLHTHRKVYPPTYGIFEEGRYFTSGRAAEACTSRRLGRVGMLVCEDLWHPSLAYVLAHDDAQMILGLAASPTRLGTGAAEGPEPRIYSVNREHHATYARLFGMYVAFVNRVGVEDGINFWGGSEVVDPSGTTVARAAFFAEDLQFCRIDPERVREARERSRHALDDDPLLTGHLLARLAARK